MLLTITTTGTIHTLYTEALDLGALGKAEIRRASNVEPGPGGWYAEIGGGGPTLGPFAKRSEAIHAEVRWLEENVL